jgi:uncharacterized membrane protein
LIFAGDITNQDECKTGNEYGCSDYGYTTPIDKETIIGIVGGIFGLIIIIIPIIIFYILNMELWNSGKSMGLF